jgi:hypothetical protein
MVRLYKVINASFLAWLEPEIKSCTSSGIAPDEPIHDLFSFKQESVSSAATAASLDARLVSAFSNSTNKGTPPAPTTAALFLHTFLKQERRKSACYPMCDFPKH